MSMPRRAMKDMGFQACCLWCDEPDEPGSSRCQKCIASHSRIREEIAKAPAEDAFYQFAKELLAMSVAPHRQYITERQDQTEQDVLEIFENQKKIEKQNIIQDIANKNRWKDRPPEPEAARKIGSDTWNETDIDTNQYHAGRTIPSKNIAPVDRSDRAGEDIEMVTRANIKAKNADVDEDILKILENEELHQRKAKKDVWQSTVSDVLDMLDDDN